MSTQNLETAAVSHAKDEVRDALEAELQNQDIPVDPDESDQAVDLIGLADKAVESLLSAGVIIPEGSAPIIRRAGLREGFEPAENSAAKNIVLDSLEAELTRQNFDPHDDEMPVELITLADCAVESLLSVGAIIPEDLRDPHMR